MVYKEKAYDKFQILVGEIEYKVVKSLFSVNPDTIVQQIQISDGDIQVNEEEVEKMLKSFSRGAQDTATQKSSGGNPLFAQPQSGQSNVPKKKIRV